MHVVADEYHCCKVITVSKVSKKEGIKMVKKLNQEKFMNPDEKKYRRMIRRYLHLHKYEDEIIDFMMISNDDLIKAVGIKTKANKETASYIATPETTSHALMRWYDIWLIKQEEKKRKLAEDLIG